MRLADVTDPAAVLDGCRYYGPCSAYVWIFYLPLVDLEAMGCYCYLASLIGQGCSEVSWQDIVEALGFPGRYSVVDALQSLESAGMVELSGSVCGVRRRLPVLDAALESQLPPRLRHIHAHARRLLPQPREASYAAGESPIDTLRRKARSTAVRLLRTGRSCDEAAVEMAARGFHPSLIASSAVWALWHLVATASDGLPFLSTLRAAARRPRWLQAVPRRPARLSSAGAPVE